MTAFVEECRREWKRLGVHDLLADEMATDLEADLAEAQADGVSAAEILGESGPRRFAATWASERGLVSDPPPPKKGRKRPWIGLAVGFVLLAFFVLLPLLAFVGGGSTGSLSRVAGTPVSPLVTVPNLVGRRACHARQIALAADLKVHSFPEGRCNALVIGQRPAPGPVVRRAGRTVTVTLRLRG
jgi:hypothetical protein